MLNQIKDTSSITLFGICPSCGANTEFSLLGIQRWPERVAKKAGLPLEQSLWQCCNCDTTLMDASLGADIKPQSSES
ncbi:MAG: hypothetical protein Q9P44_20485 [Anaerolineae bacterium]|nr:hypothetical protein [Anaerolineae bacterium]